MEHDMKTLNVLLAMAIVLVLGAVAIFDFSGILTVA
jgi:hypothetical protein